MEVEQDFSLRMWTVRDKEKPVAVVDGKSVYEVSFPYKTASALYNYLKSTGGFATVFDANK